MMSVAPDVVYDSWITIGAISSEDVSGGVINIIPGSWTTEFSAGNSFTVNDGLGSGWYLLPPGGANGLSGPDHRVLLTQLTTDGEISGSFRVQVFLSPNFFFLDISFEKIFFCFSSVHPIFRFFRISGEYKLQVSRPRIPLRPSF